MSGNELSGNELSCNELSCNELSVQRIVRATNCLATNCLATNCPCDELSATNCPRRIVLQRIVLVPPLRTIYYNINKLKQTNSLKHWSGNGRARVLSGIEKNAIGQFIRLNNEITLRKIQENLSKKYQKSVSTSTINRHLHESGYRNVLPQTIHMLTGDNGERIKYWTMIFDITRLRLSKIQFMNCNIFQVEK